VRAAGGYALVAVPATGRLDMHLVQAAVGDRRVRLATEEEPRRDFPGFELGALPPLGSLFLLSRCLSSVKSTVPW
jgi:Ala-tRNA(Pro) deacylase